MSNTIYLTLLFGERGGPKSVTALMAANFIQYPLMISPENVNLHKIKLKVLIGFKLKF